jgi:arsenate reductase
MCPHGAAKSVLASAYFQRLAKERGLNVRVISAGTDPDAAVAPAVATHLAKNGYQVPISTPQKATHDDVAAADVIISIGCDLTGFPAPRGTLQKWDDVPSPSQNFSAADDAIRKRVLALIEELVQRNATRR